MIEKEIYLTMPRCSGHLGGTTGDDHDLTVVGNETVDSCEVRPDHDGGLSTTVGTDTSRVGG
jgi:hypothetical protein